MRFQSFDLSHALRAIAHASGVHANMAQTIPAQDESAHLVRDNTGRLIGLIVETVDTQGAVTFSAMTTSAPMHARLPHEMHAIG